MRALGLVLALLTACSTHRGPRPATRLVPSPPAPQQNDSAPDRRITDIPLGSPVPVIERRTSKVAGYVVDAMDPHLLHFYVIDRAEQQAVVHIRTDNPDRVARHRKALARFLAGGHWERMEVARETNYEQDRAFALHDEWVLVDAERQDAVFHIGPRTSIMKNARGEEFLVNQSFYKASERPMFGHCRNRTAREPSDRLVIRLVAYDKPSRRVWIRYSPRVPMGTHCDVIESYEVVPEEPPFVEYGELGEWE